MISLNRWSLACLAAGAIALTACASPAVTTCGNTGIYCPAGTHCAAVQGICLPNENKCGNGIVDPDEVCDDGNTIANDNCAADCKSDNSCGNGTTDLAVGEQCDPPNGTTCSKACRMMTCGNGTTDTEIGEVCDPPDGAHCSSDRDNAGGCRSDLRCGNGIVDNEVGEVCDPPEALKCGPNCRSLLRCGDGILDPGEECDNGAVNNRDNADCRSDCVFNRCGDGRPNTTGTLHHEDCDDGPRTDDNISTAVPTETAACNRDCTANACGDGKTNARAGEECDDGANNKINNNCTDVCKRNVCGDGKQDTQAPNQEQCDDGDQDNADGCTNACTLPHCGNNIVDQGEQCDDGNTDDTDGCTNGCLFARCGDHITQVGEQCDDGNTNNADGCSSTCRSETCGNGVLDPGEECDHGASNNDGADCRSDCVLNRCGDGFQNTLGSAGRREACDRAPKAAARDRSVIPTETFDCNVDCSTPSCGDGKVNRHFTPPFASTPEQCDNVDAGGASLNSNAADCTAGCQLNVCGDGLRDTLGPLHIEPCDDGNTDNHDTCTNACASSGCGDGILGPNEDCDLGALNSDTGACLLDCKAAKCGDGKVELNVEECDGTAGCSTTCRLQECGNGIIDLDRGEECDTGVNNNNNGDCRKDCVLNRCGDGFLNTVGTHPEGCEGNPTPAAAGSRAVTPIETASCNLGCTIPACGDGVINHHFTPLTLLGQPGPGPEQCDDGLRINEDGCSADCQFERCGNGILDPDEECDGAAGLQPCSASCRQERCGNGIIEGTELCDDAAANGAGKRCNASCALNVCGDGDRLAGVEPCDDGNHDDGDTCEADCSLPRCGNAITDVGEACDDGNPIDGDTCDTNCTVPACGNRILDPGEACDDGNHTDSDGCEADCSLPVCGNGIVDLGEVCDHRASCGACTASCGVLASAHATGVIFAPNGADVSSTDSFAIDDGFGHVVTFTFSDPVVGGAPPITPHATNVTLPFVASNVAMANEIALAIAASDLLITASHVASTSVVLLTHRQPSSRGNQAIVHPFIGSFAILGMSGGAGGDCNNTFGCSVAADCASNRCVGTVCAACGGDTDCTPGTCIDGTCVP